MAVEIIIGRAGSGKTFHCIERMKKILSLLPLKTEIFFLLPAYQTYRAELALYESYLFFQIFFKNFLIEGK